MAATIHKLPRFEGERPRRLPAGEVPFDKALEILGERATEWRDYIDDVLQNGAYLKSAENGRDHVIVDGAALQSLGEDMQALARHLQNLAELQRGDT
jgi:hypothetical protein